MGPGSRHDTLYTHFGNYNWRKVIGMGEPLMFRLLASQDLMCHLIGTSLLRKMKTVTSAMHDHVIAHHEYQATIPPDSIARWTADVEAWEKDPSNPNPFEVTVKSE